MLGAMRYAMPVFVCHLSVTRWMAISCFWHAVDCEQRAGCLCSGRSSLVCKLPRVQRDFAHFITIARAVFNFSSDNCRVSQPYPMPRACVAS